MKLIFSSEESVVGLVFGLLLITYTGHWFAFSYAKTALIVLIPIYAIFMLLDIFHEVADLSRHPMFIGFSILHSIADIIICIALYSVFFGWDMPYISMIVPYLQNTVYLYYLGIFEVVSHVVWLVIAPFNQ